MMNRRLSILRPEVMSYMVSGIKLLVLLSFAVKQGFTFTSEQRFKRQFHSSYY